MHRFSVCGKIADMKTTHAPRPRKRETAAQRVVGKLLVAVEKSIAAADEAKQARDELIRLSVARSTGEAAR